MQCINCAKRFKQACKLCRKRVKLTPISAATEFIKTPSETAKKDYQRCKNLLDIHHRATKASFAHLVSQKRNKEISEQNEKSSHNSQQYIEMVRTIFLKSY